jgi:hypothetical protein
MATKTVDVNGVPHTLKHCEFIPNGEVVKDCNKHIVLALYDEGATLRARYKIPKVELTAGRQEALTSAALLHPDIQFLESWRTPAADRVAMGVDQAPEKIELPK